MNHDHHEAFMDRALEEAAKAESRGNVPVGSVIVLDGRVIGAGHNEARTGPDATAHAEVQAIRDACRHHASCDLSGATLYTSMEPCPMCCWAIIEAGIGRLVLGARHEAMRRRGDTRAKGYGNYSVERLVEMTGRSLEVVTDVRRDVCETLRTNWRDPARHA